MTKQEIKEAVQELENCLNKYGAIPTLSKLKPLLTLAEEYLALKGWPEELVIPKTEWETMDKSQRRYVQGRNEALRLCKLASMKNLNDMNMFQLGIKSYDET